MQAAMPWALSPPTVGDTRSEAWSSAVRMALEPDAADPRAVASDPHSGLGASREHSRLVGLQCKLGSEGGGEGLECESLLSGGEFWKGTSGHKGQTSETKASTTIRQRGKP